MRALTYRANPAEQSTAKPKACSGQKAIKRPGPHISGRSLLRGFWYGKSAIGKWNRADQALNGMRWNYYMSSGRGTPHFALHDEHTLPAPCLGEQDVKGQKPGKGAHRRETQQNVGQHHHHPSTPAHHAHIGNAFAKTAMSPYAQQISGPTTHNDSAAAPAGTIKDAALAQSAQCEAEDFAPAVSISPNDAGANKPGRVDNAQNAFAQEPMIPMRPVSPAAIYSPLAMDDEPAQAPMNAAGGQAPSLPTPGIQNKPITKSMPAAPIVPAAPQAGNAGAPLEANRPAAAPPSASNETAALFSARLMEPDSMPRADGFSPMNPPAQQTGAPRGGKYIGSARRKTLQLKVARADAAPER